MRFEYCCREMKEFIDDYATVCDDGTLNCEGWTYRFCPFCGEKVEATTYIRGEASE